MITNYALTGSKVDLLYMNPETVGQALQDIVAESIGIEAPPPETREDLRAQNIISTLLKDGEV